MHITDATLQSLLKESGFVSDEEFVSAQAEAVRSGQSLPNVLIGRGALTEEYLMELLEPYFGAPIIDLHTVAIASEVLTLVSEGYAKSKGLMVFYFDEREHIAKVAMTDPFDYDTIEFLRAKLAAWVDVYFVTPSNLRFGLRQYKKKIGVEFNEIISENVDKLLAGGGEVDVAKLAEAVPIVTIVDSVIDNAVALNASDIHFEPLIKEVLIRYRIDGVLHEILSLNKAIEPILVARVKVLSDLQIDEHRIPQDGRFRFEVEAGTVVDVRVNVMPVMHGEKVEMRLLKSSARPFTLEELGFSGSATAIVLDEIKKPHGMILVTGPTGHGKTTTLYAILHLLNTPDVNITTVEDPIEYEVERINQTQVNVKAGVTFANGLRALLRQNPDIIMIGEIRDNETVEISVHAALTGHLLLSSLHTNDAPSALPRLLDMGAPAFLLASTVNLIIAQRLVRKICTSCVESYPITPEMKRLVEVQTVLLGGKASKHAPQMLFRGKGCKVCGGSGFSGQIGIYELLQVSDTIRDLLTKETPVSQIRSQVIKDGMVTMFEDGMDKVERGVTTIEEIVRVVRE